LSEHRVQVQGLSEEDYDRVYLAGYQDGIEQAKYVSDYEVGTMTLSADYDSNTVTIAFEEGYDIYLLTKTVLKNMIITMQTGDYKYVFEDNDE
jgi:hypothetical protein